MSDGTSELPPDPEMAPMTLTANSERVNPLNRMRLVWATDQARARGGQASLKMDRVGMFSWDCEVFACGTSYQLDALMRLVGVYDRY